ncbi:hypothetical protein [Nostoc sp.]|uniref:hypothetical protein n=1 Tax=Nostoc sp. TaxID=1180 RepID=UPI002FFB68CF
MLRGGSCRYAIERLDSDQEAGEQGAGAGEKDSGIPLPLGFQAPKFIYARMALRKAQKPV